MEGNDNTKYDNTGMGEEGREGKGGKGSSGEAICRINFKLLPTRLRTIFILRHKSSDKNRRTFLADRRLIFSRGRMRMRQIRVATSRC